MKIGINIKRSKSKDKEDRFQIRSSAALKEFNDCLQMNATEWYNTLALYQQKESKK
jgi:hypothetical protein